VINLNLLKKLTETQSSYTEDEEMNSVIEQELSKIKGVVITKDSFGNIYATKGKGENGYKTIVCHTDTVHSIYKSRKVIVSDGVMFAVATGDINGVYTSKTIRQVGIGGDDKCGVYTCIKALYDFDNVKATFFRFEESGCRGSNACELDFFKDSNFILQCDRKGNTDFITYTNGIIVASDEFKKAMSTVYMGYGYKDVTGVATDVGTLKRRGVEVACANISSGYFDPHSSLETINLKDLDTCYSLVSDIFKKYGDTRFEHKYVPYKHTTKNTYSSFSNSRNKNFFTRDLNMDEAEVVKNELYSFINVPGTNRYKLILDEYLFLENGVKCPICGNTEEVAYYSDVAMFYCGSCDKTKEHGFINDELMYTMAIIEDGDTKFYYNRVDDVWYKEEDAVWDMLLNTYTD